jgi:predicted O-methyltransferase YrrM
MSNITNDIVEQYIQTLYLPATTYLYDMRQSAESRDIPIITRDTEMLLESILRIKHPSSILEIGTAIGYSAIFFCSVLDSLKITSIEINTRMQEEALKNIKDAGFEEQITVIKGDAADVLDSIDETFDMIFIDAAKGHYKTFFDLCLKHSKPGTIIVSDNILFKGITASEEFLDCRRNKTIMRRMRSYLKYITELPAVRTSVLPVGDGIAISVIL